MRALENAADRQSFSKGKLAARKTILRENTASLCYTEKIIENFDLFIKLTQPVMQIITQ